MNRHWIQYLFGALKRFALYVVYGDLRPCEWCGMKQRYISHAPDVRWHPFGHEYKARNA